MAKVGFIGTGEIAAAMVRGLAGQGHEITVSNRNQKVAADLAAAVPEVRVRDNVAVVRESDIVILCLLARTAREVLGSLPWRPNHAVISVMVDVPLAELADLCAPAADIALSIPMPTVAVGGCPLPMYPDSAALRALFGTRNVILPVASEAALNAHFAASALSAPILRLLAEGADWLARETQNAASAEAYVAALFKGYMTPDGSGRHFAALLDSLSTEGGLNATLRARLEAAGAPDALRDGLDGLRARLGVGA